MRRLPLMVELAATLVTGCGSDNKPKTAPNATQSTFARSIADAQSATNADFPAPRGKTLQALANTAQAGPQVGLATSVLIPGQNRLAFGVIDPQNRAVYGKTAAYIGRSPRSPAQGPYVRSRRLPHHRPALSASMRAAQPDNGAGPPRAPA